MYIHYSYLDVTQYNQVKIIKKRHNKQLNTHWQRENKKDQDIFVFDFHNPHILMSFFIHHVIVSP